MIELRHVTKRYGAKCAVDDISVTIGEHQVVGFLGRNGAGKSTTMNMITGYISASEGQILLDGMDVLEQPREVKRRIGYLPELPPLYMDMTVDEYLRFCCDIKEVRRASRKAHLDDIYNLVRIENVKDRLIKNLSKGYKQRVGLAQALIGNPEVIILDEPTVGLDPKQIIEMRRLITGLGKSHTVILSSHILSEVADVCDDVIIINQGHLVAHDSLKNLTNGIGDFNRTEVRIQGPEKPVSRLLHDIPGVKEVTSLGTKEDGSFDFEIVSDLGVDIRRPMVNSVLSGGYSLLMLKPTDVTLEDIFLRLTSEEKGGI